MQWPRQAWLTSNYITVYQYIITTKSISRQSVSQILLKRNGCQGRYICSKLFIVQKLSHVLNEYNYLSHICFFITRVPTSESMLVLSSQWRNNISSKISFDMNNKNCRILFSIDTYKKVSSFFALAFMCVEVETDLKRNMPFQQHSTKATFSHMHMNKYRAFGSSNTEVK